MTDDGADRLVRLERRARRERAARHEAEVISERVTRELYDRQQELVILETVAKAANEAPGVLVAISRCLDAIRRHGSWRLGHAWLPDGAGRMVSTGIWAGEWVADDALRRATSGLVLAHGEGLAGKVLVEHAPVWFSGAEALAAVPRADVLAQLGLRTALCFPIVVGSEVVGALEFFGDRALAPEKELLALMTQVGAQLGHVVERERAAEALLHQATHDALTGLPNRVALVDELRRSLSRQRRDQSKRTAVFFVDLDNFKTINDSLGHAAGDLLLRRVASRLATVIRPHDTLGRLGGDEFVIVSDGLAGSLAIVGIADRLGDALRDPFDFDGEQFAVTASVGIALAEGAEDPGILLEQADAAMYRAKELGGARYEVFSDALRERIATRLEIERALRQAVARGELRLHYQPEVDLRTGEVVGVEALLRWQRADGLLLPGDFIGLAEETGLITAIGAWVLDEAVRQSSTWAADPRILAAPWMSVNLSVRQLSDPELIANVTRAIRELGESPAALFLEVTESVILDDAEAGLSVLNALRSVGAEIAIDDFGTGYASLSYLRRFPASVVKVDRSFIAEVDRDPRTRSIVEAIVGMAAALGLSTVAEGIETAEQLIAVREIGFDIGQGYFFSRPLAPGDLDALLQAGEPFAAALDPVR